MTSLEYDQDAVVTAMRALHETVHLMQGRPPQVSQQTTSHMDAPSGYNKVQVCH